MMKKTRDGIYKNKAFSFNIASEDQVVATDFVGLVSGKKTDKSDVCYIFFGHLASEPMISECPINMECRLHDVYDTPVHDLLIGEIVETYAEESILKDGKVDLRSLKPLLFDMSSVQYGSIDETVARCCRVGNKMKSQ